jgi:glutathione S-transferase
MNRPTVTAFHWVPAPFQGQVRDLPVRWALEEAGIEYEERLIEGEAHKAPSFRALHPFGKVPVYEDAGIVLFESGAIVLHIAEAHGSLLPREATARAHAKAWLIAALNSVDPDVIALGDIDHFAANEAWAKTRRPQVVEHLTGRLRDVAAQLERRDYLAGEFSVADIMMVAVLRGLRHTALVSGIPFLREYRDRCESRPAFQRALAAQLQPFARAESRAKPI